MDYPDHNNLALTPEQRQRLDAEWVAVNALRETVGISRKGGGMPTYRHTLALAEHLMPEMFDPEYSELARSQESFGARQYRQMAEAESAIQNRRVTPLEVLDQEIERFEVLVDTGSERDLLRRQLDSLRQIRRELEPASYTEQQAILRDVFKVRRGLGAREPGDNYCEFELSDDRVLRLRVLHPDPPEHATGADVIYEIYWDKKRLVRLAAIQYKMWEGRSLYRTDDLASQLERLRQVFCNNDLCKPFEDSKRKDAYRFPFCSAFLRPTDKLQHSDSRLVSSGYHIPVCVVNRLWQDTSRGGWKLRSQDFRSKCVTHRVFEELFNTNMLGSKWLTYEELEALYKAHGVLDTDEHIVIRAQEFGI